MHTPHQQYLIMAEVAAVTALVVFSGADEFGGRGGVDDVNDVIVSAGLAWLFEADPHGSI